MPIYFCLSFMISNLSQLGSKIFLQQHSAAWATESMEKMNGEELRCWENRELLQRKKKNRGQNSFAVHTGERVGIILYTRIKKRQIHPMAYSKVHQPHSPHHSQSPEATTFN